MDGHKNCLRLYYNDGKCTRWISLGTDLSGIKWLFEDDWLRIWALENIGIVDV
jgi:hypothetical protein